MISNDRKNSSWQWIGQSAIIIVALVFSFSVLLIDIDTKSMQALGYAGVFIVALLSAVSLFIPGPSMVVAFTVGAVLNPFMVSVVAALGSAIGETSGYIVGRGSKSFIKNKNFEKIEDYIDRYGSLAIFLLAAIPNLLFDAAGIIAGMTGFSLYKFWGATFLGKTIRFLMAAYLGNLIASTF